jgi:hypothetical protein
MLYEGTIKVHGQTEPMTGKFEVCEQLRFVNGQQHLNNLEFHNDPFFYNEVQPKSGIKPEVIAHDGQRLLPFRFQSSLAERVQ